jgi:hypothetical protein
MSTFIGFSLAVGKVHIMDNPNRPSRLQYLWEVKDDGKWELQQDYMDSTGIGYICLTPTKDEKMYMMLGRLPDRFQIMHDKYIEEQARMKKEFLEDIDEIRKKYSL